MGKFIFKSRETKEIVFEVEMTSAEMREKHNDDLSEVYPGYDVDNHTCVYEQILILFR